MRSWNLVSALVVPVVLAACGWSDEPDSVSSTSIEPVVAMSPSSATGAPTETEESSESPVATNTIDDSVLVVLEVSGGFRGRDDRLVLSTNGHFDATTGTVVTTGSLPPADVSEIERLLSSSGLFDRPDELSAKARIFQIYVS